MTEPKRIQLSRRKGARKPEGAISVSRPTQWGNPWTIGSTGWYVIDETGLLDKQPHPPLTREQAIASFRFSTLHWLTGDPDYLEPLRGHDLACWCPLDLPCHADVLLELANAPERQRLTN